MDKVSIIYGEESNKINITKALQLLKDDILFALKNKDKILIKPNLVDPRVYLACTDKNSIFEFIKFLKVNNVNKKIIIAEGSAYDTETGFKNIGYYEIKKYYPEIEFIDLNKTEDYEIEIYDHNLNLMKIHASKIMIKKLNPDIFYVSICRAKTHDTVLVTLSIKNIIVGSLLNEKFKIHQGYKAINLSLAKIYKEYISPDLSIIDAFEAMEGDGPVNGQPIRLNLCVISLNPILADAVMTYLLGVEPYNVGYLFHLGVTQKTLEKVQIVGIDNLEKFRKRVKLHSTFQEQLSWK